MSNAASLRFSCNACNKSYAFKPEFANKKVKCKCGEVIAVPDMSAQAEEPDTYDVADEPAVPVAKPVRVAAAAPARAVPTARATPPGRGGPPTRATPSPRGGKPQPLNYNSGPTARQRQAAREGIFTDMTRDVYVPAALIAVSFVAFTVFTLFFDGAGAAGAAVSTFLMGVVFFFKTLLMIGAAFILAPILGVSFGPLWTAILKLAAVSMAPDVLATIVSESIGVPGAGILANSLALAFYWFLISYLFQMEAAEAWYVVIGFAVLRWILTIVLAFVIAGFLISGAGQSAMNSASNAASSMTNPAADFDAEVKDLLGSNLVEEGRSYIAGGRQSSLSPFVEKCYTAGAKNVWFSVTRDINGKTDPLSIVIEWPDDKAKRKDVLTAIREYYKERDKDFTDSDYTDDGGKYTEVDIPF